MLDGSADPDTSNNNSSFRRNTIVTDEEVIPKAKQVTANADRIPDRWSDSYIGKVTPPRRRNRRSPGDSVKATLPCVLSLLRHFPRDKPRGCHW